MKETMGEQEQLAHKQELLKMNGEAVEAAILVEDNEAFWPESERTAVRDILERNGVNFKPLQGEVATHEGHRYTQEDAFRKETLPAQTAFCLSALSRDKMELVISRTLEHALSQPGGSVYKKSELEGGVTDPGIEGTVAYAREYFKQLIEGDIRFSPKGQSEGVAWKENTIYRLEAIISSTYILLKTLSFDKDQGAEAQVWQTGDRVKKFLRERVLRGQARTMDKDDSARVALEKRTDQDKIVRHLPARSLGTLTQNLLGWE
jgi:hypothetical protein